MTAAVPTTATNTVSSNADIVFTTSAVGSSLVTHVAVYSAITAGTLYASAAVTASKTPAIGDGLRILSGNLTFTIN
jgi:hypothetical protein